MTTKPVAGCLLFASLVLIIPPVTEAQQPSGGRRTELEYLDRGFDLEGITAPTYTPDFWNTPEGRAMYERIQLERFQDNMVKLSELGQQDWVTSYDGSVSNGRVRRELESRTEDLEKVTHDMIRFFEWRFELEPLELEESSGETVREQLMKITPMVEQILGTISTLTGGGIPVTEFVEMRANLARIHLLSQRLRD